MIISDSPDSTSADVHVAIRHEIDDVVKGDVGDICEAIQRETRRLPLHGDRNAEIVTKTDVIVGVLRDTRDRFRAAGMFRYLMEGRSKSYSADAAPFLQFLEKEGLTNGIDTALFDLGAGPGQMVNKWKETGRPARGVDLSPSFVLENSDLRLGLIDGDYDMLLDALGSDFHPGIITTSMTLDRVRNPKQLLANVVNLARQFHTPFVVSTILPINPVDDDDSAVTKITYTDASHLLTDGRTVKEDEENIRTYIEKLADNYDIEVHTLPYTIHSSGEVHNYTQYCFCGRPKHIAE